MGEGREGRPSESRILGMDGLGGPDRGEDAHPRAAAGTFENIDGENPAHE